MAPLRTLTLRQRGQVALAQEDLRAAMAKASERHPGWEMPELVAAVDALPDVRPTKRLAPEAKGLIVAALARWKVLDILGPL